jgi:hypothetical protein
MSTEKKYKICTSNCTQYSAEKGELPCLKGNFAFVPPLGRECAFSVLEGYMERTQIPADSPGPLSAYSLCGSDDN